MKKKTSGNEVRVAEKGPVWKAKVNVLSQVSENTLHIFDETRKWEIKVIVN